MKTIDFQSLNGVSLHITIVRIILMCSCKKRHTKLAKMNVSTKHLCNLLYLYNTKSTLKVFGSKMLAQISWPYVESPECMDVVFDFVSIVLLLGCFIYLESTSRRGHTPLGFVTTCDNGVFNGGYLCTSQYFFPPYL
jgi:hypothetical protein